MDYEVVKEFEWLGIRIHAKVNHLSKNKQLPRNANFLTTLVGNSEKVCERAHHLEIFRPPMRSVPICFIGALSAYHYHIFLLASSTHLFAKQILQETIKRP